MDAIRGAGISRWRRLLHWSTALLVVALVVLGKWMTAIDVTDAEAVVAALWRFSLHKTIGVIVLVITLARVAAMIFGRGYRHSRHAPMEMFAASAVQAYFLFALIALPVSGLVMHGYASGAAPLWLVPDALFHASTPSTRIVDLAASIHHFIATGLIVAFVLHVAGALKHHVVDRDETLRRMTTGVVDAVEATRDALLGGAMIRRGYAFGIGLAAMIGVAGAATHVINGQQAAVASTPIARAADLGSVASLSELRISAVQNGNAFDGGFEQFDVRVTLNADASAPAAIEVDINSATFTSGLGDRDQAVAGGDWLDANNFPLARYQTTNIELRSGDQFEAEGTLTIREVSAPVAISFTWSATPDNADTAARLHGNASFDRFDLDLGRGDFANEKAAGRMIDVAFDVTLKKD